MSAVSGAASTPAWVPLVAGQRKREVEAVVEEIAAAVGRETRLTGSLGEGDAGVALFLSAYGKASGARTEASVTELLEEALSKSMRSPSLRWLEGLPGVAGVAEHLSLTRGRGAFSQACTAIDRLVVEATAPGARPLHFDLGGGLAGLALYTAARLPRRSARASLRRVVRQLAQRVEQDASGARWRSAPEHILLPSEKRFPGGHYDLGLAHGTPGGLVALAMAARQDIEAPTARALVEGGVRWLLSERERHPREGLPSLLSERGATRGRLAWCYGDAGFAIALNVLAELLDRPDWNARAMQIGRSLTPAHPTADSVLDASLCHGSAGLLHICNRLYQRSRDPRLRRGALSWLDRTLSERRPGKGTAGFFHVEPRRDGRVTQLSSGGLLLGASGVGLALLATVSERAPDWDRLLLMSWLPGRGSRPE